MPSVHAGIAHQPHGQTEIEYLSLEEVRVKAWVVDGISLPLSVGSSQKPRDAVSSRIVLSQTFYNSSNQPTGRAKYVFPLPASAAVCAFELEQEDGSVIVGEVKEKEEAVLSFTRAVERGNVAALVESVTGDIFTISVGSIPPATRVIAHLTFVMDLLNEAAQDHVRLQLPMHIAERYGTPPIAMHDTSAADSHTRVHITVDIQTSDVIYRVRSPTHPIAVRRYKGRSNQKSQRRMSAVWRSPEFLASDFVITVHAEGLDKPRCFAEALDARDGSGEGSTVAMQLTLVSKFLSPKVPSQEYIFVIDRSGSMSGAPIETAKRTLSMLLRLLPCSQTSFNIISFGSTVESMWMRSRALDNTSLMEAGSHVTSMSANLGGTEIPNALQSAFNSRGLDRPAAVFLLTDGSVHHADQLNALAVISNSVRASPPHAPVRLFVVGIGAGVSSDVCSSLARCGNGEYLFSLSADNIWKKCARLLRAGLSKNIERVDVDWGYDTSSSQATFSSAMGLPAGIPSLAPPPPIQQAPHSLTRIFSGFRFIVFAIVAYRSIPTTVRLITKVEGVSELQELTVDVTKVKPFRSAEDSAVPVVHTLAARKLIMELDDAVGPLPRPAPGDALLASEADLRRAGIVRLGLMYQLVSKHTSFVAVQRGDEQIRDRRRGSGSMAWARSRLRRTNLNTEEVDLSDSEVPTLLGDLVRGVSSLVTSVFGLFGGSVALTTSTNTISHSHPRHRSRFPGTWEGSDSDGNGSSRGRRRRRDSILPRGRNSPSRSSIDTFSTLSSFEGSSCSSCWSSSRPSSPLPEVHDPNDRAPSPEFLQDANTPGHDAGPGGNSGTVLHPNASNVRVPISQAVYDLFEQMDLDGSFMPSPLLAQLVGDAVLAKAEELRIDERVWATVVAVAYMQIHVQGEPDLLELVSEKAKEFVGAEHFDRMVREAAVMLET